MESKVIHVKPSKTNGISPSNLTRSKKRKCHSVSIGLHKKHRRISRTIKNLQRFSQSKVTQVETKKKRANTSDTPTNYLVLRQAFNLFSGGKAVITVNDLLQFFEQFGHDCVSYEEVREMTHKAVNEYEITFDDFRRIITSEELPGMTQHSAGIREEPKTVASLDRHAEIEQRKLNYGIYKPQFAKTFTGKPRTQSIDVLDFLVPKYGKGVSGQSQSTKDQDRRLFLKSFSTSGHLNTLEQQFRSLRKAFDALDHHKQGYLDYFDLLQVVNTVTPTKPKQIRQLFSLLGKTQNDKLFFEDFVHLYDLCR